MEYREPPQLGQPGGRPGGRRPSSGLLARILTIAAGALVLIGAIAVSLVVFAVLLVVVLGVGIYFWWKTRHVRKQMREQMQMGEQMRRQAPPNPRADGDVIEGEVIRKEESPTQR